MKSAEHAYQRIQKELKNDEIKNVLLFYGRETYLIQWAMDTISSRYVNPACRELDLCRLDGATASVKDLMNACETLPLLSSKRVVILCDALWFSPTKRKGISESDEKSLEEYLETIPKTTLLILLSLAPDKRKRLYKTVTRVGSAYDFAELPEALLRGFIKKRLNTAGCSAKPGIIAQFIDHTGYYDKDAEYTLYNLENDLKKAIAHSLSPELSAQDLMGTIAGNLNTGVFNMLDALSKGKKEEAFLLLCNILNTGENVYQLLALICSQFELMLCVKEMQQEGMNFSEITRELSVHEFRIKKALLFSESYTLADLRRVLRSAYEVDRSIKTGSLSSSLALELFVAAV